MVLVGRGPIRVCYLGSDETIADWVRAGFDRVEADVDLVVESDSKAAIDRIADGQDQPHPRMQSPLVESEDPFDCVICSDDIDAVSFIEQVRALSEEIPIVLFADDGDESLASRAITAGIDDYETTAGDDPTGELVERALDHAADYRETQQKRLIRKQTRRIVEENAEMITVISPGATVSFQNDTVESVLGYDPDEIDDKFPFERVHQDDWQAIREEFYDAVRDPEYVPRIEYRVRDANDEWRTVESRARNLLEDPLIQGFVVTTRDITTRKERERDLEGYRTVVENAGDPMYALNPDGEITWVNDAFLEHTGYEREFLENTHVSTFMREKDLEKGAAVITELLEDDEKNWGRFEFVAENVAGEIRRYENNVAILTDGDETLRGSVGVIRVVENLTGDE